MVEQNTIPVVAGDEIVNHNSTINIVPYANLKQIGGKTTSITPLKIREGWNNGHG